jgi:hypothetical protein
MRILFLSQGYKIDDHPGWNDALVKLKKENFITDFENIPYYNYTIKFGWESFYKMIYEKCKSMHFDIVYFHYFHVDEYKHIDFYLKRIKEIENPPIILTSVGDPFSGNFMRPGYPKGFQELAKFADIVFSTQMGICGDKIKKWTNGSVILCPNSMCQVRFNANSIDINNHKFKYDVVFIGSKNSKSFFNPISNHWWARKDREKLVKALASTFGRNLGLFGHGWDYSCAQGPIPFNSQQEVFKTGKIVVGGNPYSKADYYSSNRLFFEVSSGIPTLELSVPRLNKILRDDEHVYFSDDIDLLIENAKKVLKMPPEELYSNAAQAANYISSKHTQYHRMKFKITTAKNTRDNNFKLNVDFPFFLEETETNTEIKYAIRE